MVLSLSASSDIAVHLHYESKVESHVYLLDINIFSPKWSGPALRQQHGEVQMHPYLTLWSAGEGLSKKPERRVEEAVAGSHEIVSRVWRYVKEDS